MLPHLSELMVNPNCRLSVERCGGAVSRIKGAMPVRARPLQVLDISASEDHPDFAVLVRFIDERGAIAALSTTDLETLLRLGILVDRSSVSRPVRFAIPLVPAGSPRDPGGCDHVIARGTFHFDEHPAQLRDYPYIERLVAADGPIVWHDAEGALVPFAPSPDATNALHRLVLDRRVTLPSALARLFVVNGIARYAKSPDDGEKTIRRAAAAFSERKLCCARLLPRNAIAALGEYFAQLVDEGWVEFGDWQSGRFIAHNEPVARLLHHWLTRFVSQIVGTPLKPSFCYFGGYRREAVLRPHVDREQLEFTVSLMLRYTIDGIPRPRSAWPLIIETLDGTRVYVLQRCGDGTVFWGHRLRHGRAALPPNHACDAVFLGYVHQDFPGPLN